jgi:hypothetical protein
MNNLTSSPSSIVSKIWAFCNTLRDDGVGYGDYGSDRARPVTTNTALIQ